MAALTIVTTSRNDDHGYKPVERTQRHIDCLHEQAHTFKKEIEYILVEWNPPEDRKPISEVINFHRASRYWMPRIITVPKDIHYTYQNSGALPIFQMIAKNVGIRRATGKFVLCTNIDILLSDEMFLFVTGDLMQKGYSIRADRWDVPPDVPDGSKDAMLEYCDHNVIRRCGRATITDWKMNPLNRYMDRAYHFCRRKVGCHLMKMPDVHTMGCGDFTILHKDDWFGMWGYPEIEMYSAHIDSILLMQAYYSGIWEWVVPFRIYHIEHALGTSMIGGDGQALLFKNLTKRGIPYLPLSIIPDSAADMREKRANGRFWFNGVYWVYKGNKTSWGLAGYRLPEVRP